MAWKLQPEGRYSFGEFVLDAAEAALTRCGEPVSLAPKEFELLCVLVSCAGHLISKDDLIRSVWPDTFVSDSSLLRNISVLRRCLGRDCIRTVPKRGYVFAMTVERIESPATAALPVEIAQPGIPVKLPEPANDSPVSQNVPDLFPAPDLIDKIGKSSANGKLQARPWPVFGGLALLLLLAIIVPPRWPRLHAAHEPSVSMQPDVTAASPRAAAAVRLFVVNQNEDSISVLYGLTNTIRFKIPIAGNPRGAAISPDGKAVYVSLNSANAVAALDARTRKITAIIPVGSSPVGIAANPRPPFVYVANNYSDSVSVIDTRTNRVVQNLPVGSVPTEIAITPDGTRAIVTNQSGGTVTIMDTVSNTVLATVSVGSTPVGVAFTPDSKLAWVTLAGQDEIAVLDIVAKRVLHRVSAGHGPLRVVFSRDGRYALVSDFFSNKLTVIETATLKTIKKIPVGFNPVGLALDAPGDFAFVANFGSNSVTMIDMRTLTAVRQFSVGTNPVEMAALPCFKVSCDPRPLEETAILRHN